MEKQIFLYRLKSFGIEIYEILTYKYGLGGSLSNVIPLDMELECLRT
jgi:hypothetical protein